MARKKAARKTPARRGAKSPARRGSRWAEIPSARVAGVALMAVGAAMAWQSLLLPLGTLRNPGAAYLPLALSLLLAAFGAALALWSGAGPALATMQWGQTRHAAAILGVCGVSAILMEPLGYSLTSFLLLAALLGLLERLRWRVALPLSAVLAWGTYYTFAVLLKVPLPPGPFGF